MPVQLRTPRYNRRSYLRAAVRLSVETLETRCLPSIASWPGFLNPVPETDPTDTLDKAQNLGDLSVTPRAEAVGTIGSGAAGPADVDWYSFHLDHAANVTLASPPAHAGGHSVTTLSLYNSDLNDPNDPYDTIGHTLIGQADSADQAGGAQIDQRLAPGTYYVAVSGSGNHYIYPFLAGSGADGATGHYGLLITAADLRLGANDGPAVLTTDPQPGAALDRSPFIIRVDVSGPLNPQTVSAGTTIQLLGNVNGTFGDGNDRVVPLASAVLNPAGTKLLIAPAAPLAPGYYEVVLTGDSSANSQFLADPNGIPLGANSSRPLGANFSYTFHVLGNEGSPGSSTADDTPATAHQLGDVSNLPLRQISGAIGTDSDPSAPMPFDPNDVDLYHFRISDPGQHAFIAEVFAGRIGSPLFAGLSLFKAGANGQLQLLASNSGTLNGTPATNGTVPLFNDPVLYAGLTQGDYYLAVSGLGNVPYTDPLLGPTPGNGVFDPTISHSGQGGFTTGPYLLNLHVNPDNTPPKVLGTTPLEGDALGAPPTNLLVQFSKPMNLQQASFAESQQTGQIGLNSVYILAADGTKYYPRLLSYDSSTQQAQFIMLDGFPNGAYQLHLSSSGPYGLADLAGNSLVGNDASGDYVVHFSVNGPPRGTNGNPLQWYDHEPNDSVSQPQDLGVLFPHELQTGVTITRDPSRDPGTTYADTADNYRIQVLQSRDYILSLSGSGLPAGTLPTVTDAAGNTVPTLPQGMGGGVRVTLDSGTYVVGVGGWNSTAASGVKYQLQVSLAVAAENPTPLTIGPAPAYRIALAFDQPAAPPSGSPTNIPAPPPPSTPPPSPTPSAPPAGPSGSTPPPSPPSTPTTPAGSPASTPATPPAGTGSQPSTPSPSGTTPPGPTTSPPGSPVATPAVPATPSATPAAATSPAASPSSSGTAPSVSPASTPSAPPLSVAVTPSSPSVSIPRVEISVSAEASINSGVLLIANYRVGGEASSFAAIPSEVLTSLSALPVGGVRGTNRIDVPFTSDRLLAHSAEPQIRLMILNQPSISSEPDSEQQGVTPAEQVADATRQSGSALIILFKSFTYNLEGVWRGALDNLFMNSRLQESLNEWLQRLPSSATSAGIEGEAVPESPSESQEDFDTALRNSVRDDALGTTAQPWAYAGLLLGMGAALGVDVKKRHGLVPARSPERMTNVE
jgi:hypothetical protein